MPPPVRSTSQKGSARGSALSHGSRFAMHSNSSIIVHRRITFSPRSQRCDLEPCFWKAMFLENDWLGSSTNLRKCLNSRTPHAWVLLRLVCVCCLRCDYGAHTRPWDECSSTLGLEPFFFFLICVRVSDALTRERPLEACGLVSYYCCCISHGMAIKLDTVSIFDTYGGFFVRL